MVTKKQNIMVEISQNINEMAQISHIFLLKDNQTGLKVNMAWMLNIKDISIQNEKRTLKVKEWKTVYQANKNKNRKQAWQ